MYIKEYEELEKCLICPICDGVDRIGLFNLTTTLNAM